MDLAELHAGTRCLAGHDVPSFVGQDPAGNTITLARELSEADAA